MSDRYEISRCKHGQYIYDTRYSAILAPGHILPILNEAEQVIIDNKSLGRDLREANKTIAELRDILK